MRGLGHFTEIILVQVEPFLTQSTMAVGFVVGVTIGVVLSGTHTTRVIDFSIVCVILPGISYFTFRTSVNPWLSWVHFTSIDFYTRGRESIIIGSTYFVIRGTEPTN